MDRGAWQATADYSPWGLKESNMTEWLMLSLFTLFIYLPSILLPFKCEFDESGNLPLSTIIFPVHQTVPDP